MRIQSHMHSVFKFFLILLFPLYGMGTQFLVLPVNAEELSLGSHPTFEGLNSFNPALYSASTQHPDFSMSRGKWLGDVTLTHLGYAQVLGSKNILHISAKYTGLSDLEFRNAVPQDEATSTFSSYGVAMKTGLSFQQGKQRFGVSISLISMGIYNEVSSGIGLDFGYALKLNKGFMFGGTIQNLGIMTPLLNGAPELPLRLSAGLSKKLTFNDYRNTLYGSAEWNQISEAVKLKLGNHFRWNQLAILCGFASSENVVESSVGFGLNIHGAQISYAVQFGSQNIGIPQTLSIQIRIP